MANNDSMLARRKMRYRLHRILKLTLLAFACFGLGMPEGKAIPYPGSITFASQAEIDTFPSYYTSISGTLRISGSDIEDLGPLINLTSVGLNLYIQNNLILADLYGLDGITSVGRYLIISNNEALTDLSGLEGITYALRINIFDNSALSDLSSLDGVAEVGEDLTIRNNDALVNLSGLGGMSVGGNVVIDDNDALLDLTGLDGISIDETIYIISNDALTSLSGLNGVSFVKSISMAYNNALSDLSDLGQMSISGSLLLGYNNALINLDGLTGISIGLSLAINYNDALTNIDGLSGITSLNGSLSISNNDALTNLNGLSGIVFVGVSLAIFGNDALTECCGIYNLLNNGYVGGGIYIHDNNTGCDSESEISYYCSDTDQDGILNESDNCPDTANPGQEDVDEDGIGDVCDPVTEVDEAIVVLSADIEALNLVEGLETALIAKLEAAMASCANGNPSAAINQLGAFINQVEAKRGKALTNEVADDFIARATVLITAIENGLTNCGEGENFQTPSAPTSGRVGLSDVLDMELFPNPASQDVTVRLYGLQDNATLHVYSQTGGSIWEQTLLDSDVSDVRIELPAGVFVPGVYTFSLRSEGAVITQHLVVVR